MSVGELVAGLDGCAVPLVHPSKVSLARAAGPSIEEAADLAALFKLLGDPTRTRILYSLLEAGELCVRYRGHRLGSGDLCLAGAAAASDGRCRFRPTRRTDGVLSARRCPRSDAAGSVP